MGSEYAKLVVRAPRGEGRGAAGRARQRGSEGTEAGTGSMDAREAVAREEIRDVISRYNHAGDRGDLEALGLCFAESGVLDLAGRAPLEGRAAIQEHLGGVVRELAERSARPLLRHHVSSVRIELTGPDSATASSYFLVFTEVGLDHWGRYFDHFARSGESWQIARRKVRVDGAAPASRMAAQHARGENVDASGLPSGEGS